MLFFMLYPSLEIYNSSLMLARLYSVLCQSFTGFVFPPYTSAVLFLWQEFFISVVTAHTVV